MSNMSGRQAVNRSFEKSFRRAKINSLLRWNIISHGWKGTQASFCALSHCCTEASRFQCEKLPLRAKPFVARCRRRRRRRRSFQSRRQKRFFLSHRNRRIGRFCDNSEKNSTRFGGGGAKWVVISYSEMKKAPLLLTASRIGNGQNCITLSDCCTYVGHSVKVGVVEKKVNYRQRGPKKDGKGGKAMCLLTCLIFVGRRRPKSSVGHSSEMPF